MHIPLYDLFQKNDLPFLSCHRKFHNTAEHTGYLYRGKFQLLADLFLAHQGRDVQGLVPDQRKRPGGIHCHRGQHRIHILLKVFVHENSFFLGELLVSAHDHKAVRL